MKFQNHPLKTETELLARCQTIEGLSFLQLAMELGLSVPLYPHQRKGWVGQAIELALGTTAGNKSAPDFCTLGIELKTLPMNQPLLQRFLCLLSISKTGRHRNVLPN